MSQPQTGNAAPRIPHNCFQFNPSSNTYIANKPAEGAAGMGLRSQRSPGPKGKETDAQPDMSQTKGGEGNVATIITFAIEQNN